MGDKGDGTTKLTFWFINFLKPNGIHNMRIIGRYQGENDA